MLLTSYLTCLNLLKLSLEYIINPDLEQDRLATLHRYLLMIFLKHILALIDE